MGGTGTRNDLANVKRRLDEGATENQIAEEYFGEWTRHYKAFREYKRIKTQQRTWKTKVIVCHGDPGTGKSKWALEQAPEAYWKQRGNWWDGYEGQPDVVIDDYYGWLPFDTLLRLLDRYPMIVETKGGHAQFVAKTIIITSNKKPEEWYTNENLDIRALLRRIDETHHFNKQL